MLCTVSPLWKLSSLGFLAVKLNMAVAALLCMGTEVMVEVKEGALIGVV